MSLVKSPFFSIIIPCYNHGQYLSECFNSIISQSFTNWEAIVINDGSKDNSLNIGESYGQKDSRFIIINQSNHGLSAARNRGMERSKGDFFLFLDADDWLEPNCLEILVNEISNKPEFELYRFGYSYWTEPQGKRLHTHLPKGEGSIYPDILYNNLGPCHSIVIRSDFARILGAFDIHLKSCEDWDFWIRAGKMGGRVFSISENLVAYRYVTNSMSRQPYTMFEALSIVSRRAFQKDSRLPVSAFHTSISEEGLNTILNKHLIRCIGILIHHGKVNEGSEWYFKEYKKRKIEISPKEWMGLSSYLTWRYFNSKEDLLRLRETIKPKIQEFFQKIGFDKNTSVRMSSMILLPQTKKLNHLNYGRFLGMILNQFINDGKENSGISIPKI